MRRGFDGLAAIAQEKLGADPFGGHVFVLFKNAQDLRDVVAFTPLDRILIETDSPYLAPVPYRGKTNNPSFVPYVAQQVAQCKGIAVEEVGHATSRNFETLFKGVMP